MANFDTPSARQGPLKLRAADTEDLKVVAAMLQDAIVPVSDMAFLPEEKRFVLVANRFRWEGLKADTALYERVNCGVVFGGVAGVKSRGVDLKDRGRMLELLTLELAAEAIRLIFAGGAEILVSAPGVDCAIEDIGEPWPTKWRPDHAG